ncbi:MAG: flagellin, partial [SAR324 cluster bacterium]|nr:flagellin [SAR324 cluster bacterium]
MSTRINTNVSSLNAHRNVVRNQEAQSKTLERLASGLKINQGADAPAQLQISEQLRAQSAGLNQAIDNSEMAVSLIQTAEAALDEVSRALINARQITVHAANEATNDEFMLQADQQELDNILASINRIAANTQYGKNNLLDGSKAGNGVTSGENLEFLEAGANAQTSGPGGYVVGIQQSARQAGVTGTKQLNKGLIDAGEQITLTEGGRTLDFQTQVGRTVEQTLNDLDAAIRDAGLNL